MILKWMLQKQVGECQPVTWQNRYNGSPCDCDIECFGSVSFGVLLG